MFELHTTEIARVLQAVIAPAFLLAGIGTFVNVMSQRLSRVVDLARDYDAAEADGTPPHYEATRVSLNERLHAGLAARTRLLNRALALSTAAAALICALIALLFVDALAKVDLSPLIVLAFLAAMTLLIGALATLLREVFVATKTLRKAYLRAGRRPLRKAA